MSIGRLPGLLPDNPDRTRRDMVLKTDKEEKTFVLSGILVFADKIIDTETAKYIKEVVRMTQVAELLLEEGREEGRILTVKIFQEAQRNPQATSEQIAEKVGCKAQEVTDTLKMFGI